MTNLQPMAVGPLTAPVASHHASQQPIPDEETPLARREPECGCPGNPCGQPPSPFSNLDAPEAEFGQAMTRRQELIRRIRSLTSTQQCLEPEQLDANHFAHKQGFLPPSPNFNFTSPASRDRSRWTIASKAITTLSRLEQMQRRTASHADNRSADS